MAIYAILFCSIWCLIFVRAMQTIRGVRLFEREDPPEPERWPKLSIVIAACNEADTIEHAIVTLLEQDYPDMETVLIDDRSTDDTGKIVDGIAESDARVKAVHVDHLPEKWLGKVHALHVGTQEADGEWILYTDADVHFRQGTLRKSIAFALAEQADHVALLPKPLSQSFWMEVCLRTFGNWFLQMMKASRVGKPGSNAFIGVGAFNLVRRSAFDKTDGFPWLRMEVADDVGLGLLLHRSGARARFAMACQHITVTWYPSIRAMFRGSEKGGALYTLPRVVFMLLFQWALVPSPFVAIVYVRVPYLWAAGVAVFLFMAANAHVWHARLGNALLPSLFIPIGQGILSLMMLHSAIMCTIRGGAVWRDTKYSKQDLRASQRVML